MEPFPDELNNSQNLKFHLVEEQNEVKSKGQEESQEAQVVEVSREVVLQKKMMNNLKARKRVGSSSCSFRKEDCSQGEDESP